MGGGINSIFSKVSDMQFLHILKCMKFKEFKAD